MSLPRDDGVAALRDRASKASARAGRELQRRDYPRCERWTDSPVSDTAVTWFSGLVTLISIPLTYQCLIWLGDLESNHKIDGVRVLTGETISRHRDWRRATGLYHSALPMRYLAPVSVGKVAQ